MFRLGLRELERAPCQTTSDARRTGIKPTSTLRDSDPPLPLQSRGVLTTNTKGVVGCLKNLAVETNRIAFRSWQRLSDQVGFEPTATAKKLVGVMGLEPIILRVRI